MFHLLVPQRGKSYCCVNLNLNLNLNFLSCGRKKSSIIMKKITLSLLLAAAFAVPAEAQGLKLPAMSPTQKLTQDFSLSNIEITYSRPSVRGRKVFGELVPFGKVWRTGANAATIIRFGEDVTFGGKDLKAGEYELFTIPGKDNWEVVLNRGKGDWGAYTMDDAKEVLRIQVKPEALAQNIETFTIQVGNMNLSACTIDLMWEKTRVSIPVKANNQDRILADIDKAINKPSIPYYQAASYYYETGQDLNQAMDWVNKALEQNPKAYYMWHTKAKIAAKMGDKQTAREAAQKSMEAAKGTSAEDEYRRNNEKLLAELK